MIDDIYKRLYTLQCQLEYQKENHAAQLAELQELRARKHEWERFAELAVHNNIVRIITADGIGAWERDDLAGAPEIRRPFVREPVMKAEADGMAEPRHRVYRLAESTAFGLLVYREVVE